MIKSTVSSIAISLVVCLVLSYVAGLLHGDALDSLSRLRLGGLRSSLESCEATLVEVGNVLEIAAEDLATAERVCSVWRETARWYQRAYLCSAHLESCPKPKPPSKPRIKAPATAPITATIGTP